MATGRVPSRRRGAGSRAIERVRRNTDASAVGVAEVDRVGRLSVERPGRESALAHNSGWMQRYLKATGALIAPHGKTTMSPQLFARQVADGAWAITLGSVEQVQVARQYGFSRLLLANQPVGRQSQRYIVEELKRDSSFDFYCFVDSVALVRQLSP